MHLGMSDMSILRFARKPSYGYFSAAGMYIGHYMAWLCAGLMGATAALLAGYQLTQMDPGGVSFRILGAMGLIAVVIAGWTRSIPSLYRAGLAFQAVFPKQSRERVATITGVATTLITCFSFVFTQWLNVLSYFIMLIAPLGAIIAAEHFLLPRMNIRPFWREHLGLVNNRPAFMAWGIGVLTGIVLMFEGSLHLFTLFIPVWLTSFIAYPLLYRLQGVFSEKGIDFYQEAYGPLNPVSELKSETVEHRPVRRLDPWYFTAVACLAVILGMADWSWRQGIDATAHLDIFLWCPPCSTLWQLPYG